MYALLGLGVICGTLALIIASYDISCDLTSALHCSLLCYVKVMKLDPSLPA